MFLRLGAEIGVSHKRVAVVDGPRAFFADVYRNRMVQDPIKKLSVQIEQCGELVRRQAIDKTTTLFSRVYRRGR